MREYGFSLTCIVDLSKVLSKVLHRMFLSLPFKKFISFNSFSYHFKTIIFQREISKLSINYKVSSKKLLVLVMKCLRG